MVAPLVQLIKFSGSGKKIGDIKKKMINRDWTKCGWRKNKKNPTKNYCHQKYKWKK